MRGRFKRERGRYELALYSAWQGERFTREDKLKPFNKYLSEARASKSLQRAQTAGEALAVFSSLHASGVPMKITRIGSPRTAGESR
jgi:hypothetical protein